MAEHSDIVKVALAWIIGVLSAVVLDFFVGWIRSALNLGFNVLANAARKRRDKYKQAIEDLAIKGFDDPMKQAFWIFAATRTQLLAFVSGGSGCAFLAISMLINSLSSSKWSIAALVIGVAGMLDGMKLMRQSDTAALIVARMEDLRDAAEKAKEKNPACSKEA